MTAFLERWVWVAPLLAGGMLVVALLVATWQIAAARTARLAAVTLYACNAPVVTYQARDSDVHRGDDGVTLTTLGGLTVEWHGAYAIVGAGR